MNDIYKKIKSKYPDYKVTNNKDKQLIEITEDNIKVEAYKDTIHLIVDNKYITHCHTNDFDTEEEIYDTIEYYLNDYKEIIEHYRKQEIVRKMLFIVPIAVVIIITIILVCVENNRKQHFYDNLKKNMQDDIERVLHLLYPHCQVGHANPGLLLEESQNNYYGIDKRKLLDIDGKSYCKIKVKTKCVEDSKLDWETYIKCKDYEDEEYSK